MASELQRRRQTIDTSNHDDEFIEETLKELDMLCGLVEEMMETDPRLLLSPLFRRVLRDKGREVGKRVSILSLYRMYSDNLHETYKEQFRKRMEKSND